MSGSPDHSFFKDLYREFSSPLSEIDCGLKCGPYNDYGVPICCDIQHTIPAAFEDEWAYLKEETDLWKPWSSSKELLISIEDELQDGQVLLECLGHKDCQRPFRTLTCRAFPFYPYMTKAGDFIGLTYYWEYEDRCWVINHLQNITSDYVQAFVKAYDWIFVNISGEFDNFRYHSIIMRRVFGRKKRAIPLLHRNGCAYSVTPKDGKLNPLDLSTLRKFGPYEMAALMPFPDEV